LARARQRDYEQREYGERGTGADEAGEDVGRHGGHSTEASPQENPPLISPLDFGHCSAAHSRSRQVRPPARSRISSLEVFVLSSTSHRTEEDVAPSDEESHLSRLEVRNGPALEKLENNFGVHVADTAKRASPAVGAIIHSPPLHREAELRLRSIPRQFFPLSEQADAH
jgi:hypothetical protein